MDVEQYLAAIIIIAHKERLVRFGYEWFEDFCKRHDCEIVVINAQSLSPEGEVTQGLFTIIHCFSSRLYGLRRHKKELKKMITDGDNEND